MSTATLTHADQLTPETLIVVEADEIVFHSSFDCNDIHGDLDGLVERLFGEGIGKFPCGTCIDVDHRVSGRHLTEARDSLDAPDYGTGSSRSQAPQEPVEELSVEQVVGIIKARNGKFADHDMTPSLEAFAKGWLAAYTGDFGFLVDLKSKRRLSTGQLRGVMNCVRAAYFRGEFGDQPEKREKTDTALDLSSVPSGAYAVPGGDTRLKVQIDNVAKGKWKGWVFVKDAAVYGSGQKYGSQKPGGRYKGDIEDALRAIAADPLEASKAYGRLTSRCGRCGRPLEDEDSVANGIGPICAEKGW